MAFARFGPDSDVYVYESAHGVYRCERCPRIGSAFQCETAEEMVQHLEEHVARGDKVPGEALTELRQQ
jgi:hypothetical protein